MNTITNRPGTTGIDSPGPTDSHHVRELTGSAQEGQVGEEEPSSFHPKVVSGEGFSCQVRRGELWHVCENQVQKTWRGALHALLSHQTSTEQSPGPQVYTVANSRAQSICWHTWRYATGMCFCFVRLIFLPSTALPQITPSPCLESHPALDAGHFFIVASKSAFPWSNKWPRKTHALCRCGQVRWENTFL